MIDTTLGKPPTMNRHHDDPAPTVQKEIRELLRIARILQSDRRKNTRDRRKPYNPDVIVDLSSRPERRTRLDRRQKQELLLKKGPARERRRSAYDRRELVNDGIVVTLSTRPNRRTALDRRRERYSPSVEDQRQDMQKSEVRECIETMKGLIEKLQKYL